MDNGARWIEDGSKVCGFPKPCYLYLSIFNGSMFKF